MILRHLRDGTDELIGSVIGGRVQPTGDGARVYGVDDASATGTDLHLVSIGNWSRRVLDNMRADYARLTWDDSGTALAALRGMDRRGFAEKENSLIAFDEARRAEPRRSCSGASS